MIEVARQMAAITPEQEHKIIKRFYEDFIGSMYDRAKYAIESVLGPQEIDIEREMKKLN